MNQLQGCTIQYIAAYILLARDQEFVNAVLDKDSNISLEYRHLSQGSDGAVWVEFLAKDLVRLAQGAWVQPKGINTIFRPQDRLQAASCVRPTR